MSNPSPSPDPNTPTRRTPRFLPHPWDEFAPEPGPYMERVPAPPKLTKQQQWILGLLADGWFIERLPKNTGFGVIELGSKREKLYGATFWSLVGKEFVTAKGEITAKGREALKSNVARK